MARARKPEIVADAAHAIFTRQSRAFTGQFCIDEEVLRAEGVTDFGGYSDGGQAELIKDLFIP
jgi:citronellol/citronellal dehydrogenase